jgi:hypothetical protein
LSWNKPMDAKKKTTWDAFSPIQKGVLQWMRPHPRLPRHKAKALSGREIACDFDRIGRLATVARTPGIVQNEFLDHCQKNKWALKLTMEAEGGGAFAFFHLGML